MPVAHRTARTPEGLVVSVRPIAQAASLLGAWRELSAGALVENLFYEPDFAQAAAYAFGQHVSLLTVEDRPGREPGSRLLALWPCRIVRRWGLPLPALMGWTHGFSIFGAPLLASDCAEAALQALLDAPQRLGLPRRLLMPYLPLEGPFATLLDRVLARSGGRRRDYWTHERGFLDLRGASPEARRGYLANQLSHRKARQLARLFRRAGHGVPLAHEILQEAADLPAALADYVNLEAAGWKGRAGTAVAQRPAEGRFLDALVRSYGATGRARIDRLRRGDRTLASSLSLRTASTFWFLKISHDEDEARNSPGALLVERVTRSLLEDSGIAAGDSCAPPDFPLIETFWGQRLGLAHGLIEAGGGDRWFPLAARLEGLRAQASRARDRRRRPGTQSSA